MEKHSSGDEDPVSRIKTTSQVKFLNVSTTTLWNTLQTLLRKNLETLKLQLFWEVD